MHLVVDAVAVRTGSVTVVLEHLLRGWADRHPGDRITVLVGPEGPDFPLPGSARTHVVTPRPAGPLGQAWRRSVGVRRAARAVGADAVLLGVPASALLGTPCPRAMILYDLRHELRPHQFSRASRAARRLSWGWSMRRSDRIFTISERTLDDLRRRHPGVAGRAVAAPLGSDHVLAWPEPEPADPPYALAFGHYSNKNADAVLAGWADFCRTDEKWLLRLVGMSSSDRAAAQEQVTRLGIEDRVELMPWLDDDAFVSCFVGAGLVVFPSDFEGFGLPAAEALRLGIPTVVSDDPALAEVTGGHAITAASTGPADLADAVRRALALTDEQRAAGQTFAGGFTWGHTADIIRNGLR